MNIRLTEILSLAALIVSALSMLYAKKQSEFAKKDYINAYRSHLTQSHLEYRKALIETQKKHEEELHELSLLAGNVLTDIVYHFDQYDTDNCGKRYLRHLLHESSEMVFRTFQGQLSWQTAENISHRISQTSFIEDKLNPIKNIFGDKNFRENIKNKYYTTPDYYLETDLINDIHFCNLVSEIKIRIAPEKLHELMSYLQKQINIFNQLHNHLKPKFSQSARYLKELIHQGDKEHFQLRESHQLFNEMKKTQSTLNTLGYISIPEEIDRPFHGEYHFSVSKSIHICTLLHAIQSLHSWGWNHQ